MVEYLQTKYLHLMYRFFPINRDQVTSRNCQSFASSDLERNRIKHSTNTKPKYSRKVGVRTTALVRDSTC